jgi:fucose permease
VDNSDVEDDVSSAENESSDCKRSSDSSSIAAKCVLKVDKSVPLFVKLIIFIFYFLYVGTESGFSGWISMYSLNMKITSNESAAAYLCSYFWTGLTIGRLLAIPQSLCLSASAMIRFQLLISLAGSICFWYLPTASYLATGIISFLFGFALSSIFPLMMIIVADYGFVM